MIEDCSLSACMYCVREHMYANAWVCMHVACAPAVVGAPVTVVGDAAGDIVVGTGADGLVGANVTGGGEANGVVGVSVVAGASVVVGVYAVGARVMAGASVLHRHSLLLLHDAVLLAVFILSAYAKKK